MALPSHHRISTIIWGNDYPHAEGTFRGQPGAARHADGVPDEYARPWSAAPSAASPRPVGAVPRLARDAANSTQCACGIDRHCVENGGVEVRWTMVSCSSTGGSSSSPAPLGHRARLRPPARRGRGAAVVVNDLGASIEGGSADEIFSAAVIWRSPPQTATTADLTTTCPTRPARRRGRHAVAAHGRLDAVSTTPGSSAGRPSRRHRRGLRRPPRRPPAGLVPRHPGGVAHLTEQGTAGSSATTSSGLLSLPMNAGYASAKAASSPHPQPSTAGRKAGIKVNAIARRRRPTWPGAAVELTRRSWTPPSWRRWPPTSPTRTAP